MIRNKGNSLLEIVPDYTIIDLETTGLDPHSDEIIEIACVKFRNFKEIDRFTSLVHPERPIPSFITIHTGISNEMVASAPRFADITDNIISFLHDDIIIGHNVHFDINFLYDNLLKTADYTFSNDFIDTMRLSRLVLPDLYNHKLETVAEYFKSCGTHHRAEADCDFVRDALIGMMSIVNENHLDLHSLYKKRRTLDLKSITGDVAKNDPTHIFYDKNCVFTGKLEKFIRSEAAQIVTDIGGHCENGITKRTNFLIMGNFDYCHNITGKKSSKMKKAEDLILKGQDLKIINENVFEDLVQNYIDNSANDE